ncbi:MAG: hypothetical protein KA419_13660 [Acidobacteria bacterium]|nr:hypothetical protein [Acidobacteriota bacterium]
MPTRTVIINIHGSLPSDTRPTVGNGLRARALGDALAARGTAVSYLAHRQFYAEETPPPGVTLFDTDLDFRRAVETAAPDLLVCVQGEGLEYLPEEGFPVPVLADWIAPRMLEFAFQGLPLEKWLPWWVAAARKADYHACCTERQRAYLSFLLQLAGIPLEPDRTLRVPLAAGTVAPPRPPRGPEPVFVAGGVSWPWIRSERFLRLLLEEMDAAGRGHLHVFGGTYLFGTDANAYRDPTRALPSSARLTAHGMVPYPELLEAYAAADVALDLFEENAERRLALSFREMDYLRCGVPLVCPAFSEIAGEVAKARAGWVLADLSDHAVRAVFRKILSKHPLPESFSQAARGIAAGPHAPDRVAEPIRALLDQGPSKAAYGPALFQSALLWSEHARLELERLSARLRAAEEENRKFRGELQTYRALVEEKEAGLLRSAGSMEELRRYADDKEQRLAEALRMTSEKDQALGWQRSEIAHFENALARVDERIAEVWAQYRRKEEECARKYAEWDEEHRKSIAWWEAEAARREAAWLAEREGLNAAWEAERTRLKSEREHIESERIAVLSDLERERVESRAALTRLEDEKRSLETALNTIRNKLPYQIYRKLTGKP